MDPTTAVLIVKWGLRIGLKVREVRILVRAVDLYASEHGITRRRSLEWIAAAKSAPERRIFIAGADDVVHVANPRVRTLAERALINQARWPADPRLQRWLDTVPA
jgi:hypothetical protein